LGSHYCQHHGQALQRVAVQPKKSYTVDQEAPSANDLGVSAVGPVAMARLGPWELVGVIYDENAVWGRPSRRIVAQSDEGPTRRMGVDG
jgi:hypothetical protein